MRFFGWFRRNKRRALIFGPDDPRNHLGMPAIPVALYHDVLGQIVILLQYPPPKFLADEYFGNNQVRCFAMEDGFIPGYFYGRSSELAGWHRVDRD